MTPHWHAHRVTWPTHKESDCSKVELSLTWAQLNCLSHIRTVESARCIIIKLSHCWDTEDFKHNNRFWASTSLMLNIHPFWASQQLAEEEHKCRNWSEGIQVIHLWPQNEEAATSELDPCFFWCQTRGFSSDASRSHPAALVSPVTHRSIWVPRDRDPLAIMLPVLPAFTYTWRTTGTEKCWTSKWMNDCFYWEEENGGDRKTAIILWLPCVLAMYQPCYPHSSVVRGSSFPLGRSKHWGSGNIKKFF